MVDGRQSNPILGKKPLQLYEKRADILARALYRCEDFTISPFRSCSRRRC